MHGNTLVSYTAGEEKLEATPDPADPLLPPSELKSTEELYLGALHLEQYRHATFSPDDYYLEGLRRDPSDIRLTTATDYYNIVVVILKKLSNYSRKRLKSKPGKTQIHIMENVISTLVLHL
mgnify:CR=1 FL=1